MLYYENDYINDLIDNTYAVYDSYNIFSILKYVSTNNES